MIYMFKTLWRNTSTICISGNEIIGYHLKLTLNFNVHIRIQHLIWRNLRGHLTIFGTKNSLATQECDNIPFSNFVTTPFSDPLFCSSRLPEFKYG